MINFLNILKLVLSTEFLWLESYLNNDQLWLNSTINWEQVSDIILNDISILSWFNVSFFVNNVVFLDFHTKFSFFDLIITNNLSSTNKIKLLYNSLFWDISLGFFNIFAISSMIFYTDYQNYLLILLKYSPELLLTFSFYFDTYWNSSIINYLPSVVYDLFNDNIISSILELIEYGIFFFFLFDSLFCFLIHYK